MSEKLEFDKIETRETICLSLPKDIIVWLKKIKKNQKISVSRIVEQILNKYIDNAR